MEPNPNDSEELFEAPARLLLFGFEPTTAVVTLRPRRRRWRVSGAIKAQAGGLLAAPLVGLVPPHVPWALGAVGVGFVLARRRWRHRFTVEAVRGACPKCGAALAPKPGMLRTPHPVACESCHHESKLEVDPTEVAAHAASEA